MVNSVNQQVQVQLVQVKFIKRQGTTLLFLLKSILFTKTRR